MSFPVFDSVSMLPQEMFEMVDVLSDENVAISF